MEEIFLLFAIKIFNW